ncbi:hypothetical protein MD484_g3860, partial [Candolleomyces efflorescens]
MEQYSSDFESEPDFSAFICSRVRKPLENLAPFKDGVIEDMVEDIRRSVECQLLGALDANPDYQRKRISLKPTTITSPDPRSLDVAAAYAERLSHIELDSTGQPSRQPKSYEEALLFFAQGWYPLPATIRSVRFSAGVFLDTPPILPDQKVSIAIVTTLGERYPSLGAVTFVDGIGYPSKLEMARGMEASATTWSVLKA